jgi:hypothetical protein
MTSEVAPNLETNLETGGQGMNRGDSKYFDDCVGTEFGIANNSMSTSIIITSC